MTLSIRQISEAQERYIDSQIKLFDAILSKVDRNFDFENYDNVVKVAQTIYLGYALTDIEEAVRSLER